MVAVEKDWEGEGETTRTWRGEPAELYVGTDGDGGVPLSFGGTYGFLVRTFRSGRGLDANGSASKDAARVAKEGRSMDGMVGEEIGVVARKEGVAF